MSERGPSTSALMRDEIEKAILIGELPPGRRLDEVMLAERFGVSRTPIREALIQLSASGLIEIVPRRGATVAKLEPDRLVEMFDVMAELEAMAVRLAARRQTADDVSRILEGHDACKRAAADGDPDAYYYENERFHYALYDASHHGYLIEQCRLLHRRLKPYRRLQLRVRQRMAVSLREHDAIVTTVLAFDGEKAAELMRAHVAVQGERFTDLLASLRRPESAAG